MDETVVVVHDDAEARGEADDSERYEHLPSNATHFTAAYLFSGLAFRLNFRRSLLQFSKILYAAILKRHRLHAFPGSFKNAV